MTAPGERTDAIAHMTDVELETFARTVVAERDALAAALESTRAELAAERAKVQAVETVRLCHTYEHRDGWNIPTGEYDLPVRYDPTLPTRGETQHRQGYSALHPTAIVLREWDERVLLHEVLHALLDTHVQRTADDPHGHRVIAHLEVALRLAGWRFAPALAAAQPTGDRS